MAAAKKPEPEVHVHDMSKLRGTLKAIGGSMSDDWNNILANQTVQTLWVKNSDPEEIRRQRHAAVDALIGMAPRDESRGCSRRSSSHATTPRWDVSAGHDRRTDVRGQARESQPGEQALADIHDVTGIPQSSSRQRRAESHGRARSRSRGRTSHRRQRREPGGGFAPKSEDQPHALAHAPGTTMPSTDTTREPVPVAGYDERPMPDARGNVSRRAEGE
jgi:hypothetical protein